MSCLSLSPLQCLSPPVPVLNSQHTGRCHAVISRCSSIQTLWSCHQHHQESSSDGIWSIGPPSSKQDAFPSHFPSIVNCVWSGFSLFTMDSNANVCNVNGPIMAGSEICTRYAIKLSKWPRKQFWYFCNKSRPLYEHKTQTNPAHTSSEESSRAKKCFITFDLIFWCYLPSRSIFWGSRK